MISPCPDCRNDNSEWFEWTHREGVFGAACLICLGFRPIAELMVQRPVRGVR